MTKINAIKNIRTRLNTDLLTAKNLWKNPLDISRDEE